MLILLLGYLFLTYWSFHQTRGQILSASLPLFQKKQIGIKAPFFDFFLRSSLFAFFSGSQQVLAATGWSALEKGQSSYRWNLLWICFSGLGALLALLLAVPLFQISGGFLLVAGVLAFALKRWPALASGFWALFFWGLFLFAMESTLRAGGFLANDPDYQGVVFFLADNRLETVLTVFVAAVLVTFVIRLEYVTWVIAWVGLSLGIMGLTFAMGLVIGESLGWSLIHYWILRKSRTGASRLGLEVLLIKVTSALLFLGLYGFVRNSFVFPFSLGAGMSGERVGYFLLSVLVWVVFSTGLLMVWGHFRALTANPVNSLADTSVLPKEWILPTFVRK